MIKLNPKDKKNEIIKNKSRNQWNKNRWAAEKINKGKRLVFEKFNKLDEPLAKLVGKKREKTNYQHQKWKKGKSHRH